MVGLNLLKRRNDHDSVVCDKTRYVLIRPRGDRLRFPVVVEIRTICLLSLCTIAHRSLVDSFARQRNSVLKWEQLNVVGIVKPTAFFFKWSTRWDHCHERRPLNDAEAR
jgi:hypothetical protein